MSSNDNLMFGHLGNGISVCDTSREEHGDYVKLAHISPERRVVYYSNVSPEIRERIEKFARTAHPTVSVTQSTRVFSTDPEDINEEMDE